MIYELRVHPEGGTLRVGGTSAALRTPLGLALEELFVDLGADREGEWLTLVWPGELAVGVDGWERQNVEPIAVLVPDPDNDAYALSGVPIPSFTVEEAGKLMDVYEKILVTDIAPEPEPEPKKAPARKAVKKAKKAPVKKVSK